MKTYRISVIYQAMSQITHMSGTSGNEALINRESVYTKDGIKKVPVISGNALRHRSIREPGAKHLVAKYDLSGKLTVDQVNFMLTGGSLSESSVTDNLKVISDLKEYFPLYRLLGGSLRNQIIAGSLQFGRALLLCEETKEILNKTFPKELNIDNSRLKSFEEFISNYQYTRGDIKNKKDVDFYLEAVKLSEEKESTLMIYAGQTVMIGSLFFQDIIMPNISEIELGSLLNAFSIWQDHGGVIGGKGSIGHGKLKAFILIESDDGIINNYQDFINLYNEYIMDKKDSAIEWLFQNLGDRPKKEKEEKPKKAKKEKESTQDEIEEMLI